MATFEVSYRLADQTSATARVDATNFDEAVQIARSRVKVLNVRMVDENAEVTVTCPRCGWSKNRLIDWGLGQETRVRCASCESQLRLRRQREVTEDDRPQSIVAMSYDTTSGDQLFRWRVATVVCAGTAAIAVLLAAASSTNQTPRSYPPSQHAFVPSPPAPEVPASPLPTLPTPPSQELTGASTTQEVSATQGPSLAPASRWSTDSLKPPSGSGRSTSTNDNWDAVRTRLQKAGLSTDSVFLASQIRRLMTQDSVTDPPTGVVRRTFVGGLAPFSVRTDGESGYYIKVLHVGTEREVLTAFIRRGDRLFETDLPLGTYEIRYAAGQRWYGEVLDFGLGLGGPAAYSRCQSAFEFSATATSYVGHSIELILQRNGNLETNLIDPASF